MTDSQIRFNLWTDPIKYEAEMAQTFGNFLQNKYVQPRHCNCVFLFFSHNVDSMKDKNRSTSSKS